MNIKTKIKAEKKWGQHFLHDQKVISLITQDFIKQAQAILEIGPGPGALTKILAKQDLPFLAIDIDERVREANRDLLTDQQIIIGDAMKIDLGQSFQQHFSPSTSIWLVSNLPYNASSQLLVKFLPLTQIRYMTLMFQKEVGEKVLMKEKENVLACSLGMLSQSFFEIKKKCLVKPGSFSPPPKVDSIVLSFERREVPLVDLLHFERFQTYLRKLFSRPRKQIKSFWAHEFGSKPIPLKDLELREDLRAEKLTLSQTIEIFNRLCH